MTCEPLSPFRLNGSLRLTRHGFNVDTNFSNALDGLIMVDLRQTDAAVLAKSWDGKRRRSSAPGTGWWTRTTRTAAGTPLTRRCNRPVIPLQHASDRL